MARKRFIVNKEAVKKLDGCCFFCGEENYSLLDLHRISYDEIINKYTIPNTLTVCANCHRLIHSGDIIIDKKYQSTSGQMVLHYWKDGVEFWG